ncbi:hypothetical protein HMPREF9349_03807, partial [Escherichia coli MS 79-10]
SFIFQTAFKARINLYANNAGLMPFLQQARHFQTGQAETIADLALGQPVVIVKPRDPRDLFFFTHSLF